MEPGFARTTASVLNVTCAKAATIGGKVFGVVPIVSSGGFAPANLTGVSFRITTSNDHWTFMLTPTTNSGYLFTDSDGTMYGGTTSDGARVNKVERAENEVVISFRKDGLPSVYKFTFTSPTGGNWLGYFATADLGGNPEPTAFGTFTI